MAGHGIPRITELEPCTTETRAKEQQEIDEYKNLSRQVDEKICELDFSSDTLRLTTRLVTKNPEYYTAWNHRRKIFLETILSKGSKVAIKDELVAELSFLVPLIRKFSKCYALWKYRLWILEQASLLLPVADAEKLWTGELNLVGKMLSRDERNFHGWEYRRKVIQALESEVLSTSGKQRSLVKAEFDYTTKMINQNLSNFSAWHNRTKLIPRLLEEEAAESVQRQSMLEKEINLLHEALIDPYDQSLWFYHAYLMAAMTPDQAEMSIAPALNQQQRLAYLQVEIDFIIEMLDDTRDCRWIYQSLLRLVFDYHSQAGTWPKAGGKEQIAVWMRHLEKLDPLREGRWKELESKLESTT